MRLLLDYTTWDLLWGQAYNETEIDTLIAGYPDFSYLTSAHYNKTESDAINDSMKNYVDDTFLTELHDDTTPQLGGYLDADGENIGATDDEIENIYVGDTTRIYFGDGQDASIYYNGTALLIG